MQKKRCFVISPIGSEGTKVREHADDVFNYIIKPAADECGVDAYRSDQMPEPGRITDQMFNAILHEDFCIAVLTGHNPNVFYELAVAQAAGKPVIILLESGADLPFDAKDLRFISYDLKPRSITSETYKAELVSNIRTLEAQGWTAESILTRFGASSRNPSGNRSISSIRNDPRIWYFLRGIKESYFRRLTDLSKPATIRVRLNIMAPDDGSEDKRVTLRIAAADYLTDYDDLEHQEKWYEGQGKCGVAWQTATQQIFAADLKTPETSFEEMGSKSETAHDIKSVISTPVLWNEKPVAILNMDSFNGSSETFVDNRAVKEVFLQGAREIWPVLISK